MTGNNKFYEPITLEDEPHERGILMKQSLDCPIKDQKGSRSKVTLFIKDIFFHNILLISAANTCLFITASVQAYVPYLCGSILDSITSQSQDSLNYNAMFFIFLILVNALFAFFRGVTFEVLAERIIFYIKNYFYSRILYNDISFFERNKSGELISRFTSDITSLQSAISEGFCNIIRNLIQFIISLTLIFFISTSMSTILILLVAPGVLIIIKYAKYMKGVTKEYQDQLAESNSFISEAFLNVRITKAFSAEIYERNKFVAKSHQVFNLGRRRGYVYGLFLSLITIISFGLILFVLYYGGMKCVSGEITPGQLSSFILYTTTLSFSLFSISSSVSQIVTGRATLDKLLELVSYSNSRCESKDTSQSATLSEDLLDELSKPRVNLRNKIIEFDKLMMKGDVDQELASELSMALSVAAVEKSSKPIRTLYNDSPHKLRFNSIEFNDVSFGYTKNASGKDYIPVLKNINFKISKGSKIGIAGPSGAGKSTMISLLIKFYEVNAGVISIDGAININAVPLRILRNSIAYVPQEPSLFSGTILSNILYGIDSCSEEVLNQALEDSYVSEFVNNKSAFPQGLNTTVGEKGVTLSGGQKQRIAIARALIRNPSLYIFDEATSALDSISEDYVQQSINNIICKGDNTVIIIAHRLSTIINCDRILVFKDGQIIESGTHKDLMSESIASEYKRLFQKQMSSDS